MGVVRFCVGALLLVSLCAQAQGVYENNPFLSNKVVPPAPTLANPAPTLDSADELKQNIQQIAVVLPPGTHHQTGTPSHNQSYQPGTVIVNLPPYYPQAPITSQPQPPMVPSYQPVQPTYSPILPPLPEPADGLSKWCLKPRGQFPSAKCNKFVNCWDGVVVEQFCPIGLLFNSAGFCDYAYNVDCKGRPHEAPPAVVNDNPAPVVPTANYPGITPEPISDTSLPPSYRPTVDTQPPIYIPAGSVPDNKLREKCLGPRGLYPSAYCNKYVNCWDQFAIEQECPPGLLFSEKGYCDYAYNVNCYNRATLATPVTQPPVHPTPPINSSEPSKPPQYSSPIVTIPTVPTVPPFNDVTTPSTPKPSAATSVPLPPVYVPAGVAPDDKLRKKCLQARGQFPSDVCNRYANCWDGFVVEQDCPPGLLFSEKGYCDYAYNVNCGSRVVIPFPVLPPSYNEPVSPPSSQPPTQPDVQTPPPHQYPSTSTPTVPPTVQQPQPTTAAPLIDERLLQKCAGLRGQFPSDSCHKYIDCWNEFAAEYDCPAGLLFSEKGYCDYPYNVNCHNRTVTNNTQNPACPNPNGTYRDQSNCSRYFTCVDNVVAVKFDCPAGLHFNEIVGVCDYAYKVDCKREPFAYQSPQNTNFIQKVPAALIDATLECKPGKVYKLNPECTSAALCRESMTEVIHCPLGLAYDAPSDRCLPVQMARW